MTELNHVSVSAPDLESSVAFYEDLFGFERVATPNFGFPVQWLEAGGRQLHLFERPGPAPASHHFALTVDDLESVYDEAGRRGCFDTTTFSNHLIELPGDTVQLYLRDPGGNLVEVDAVGVSRLPARIRAELVRLEEIHRQGEENLRARLPVPGVGG